MIAFIFNVILVVLFIGFIAVCVTAFRIYRSLHSMKRKFTEARNASGRHNGTHWNSSNATRTDGEEVVIDNRSPGEAKRKIFSKNEGEYVDFEEERPH